MSGDGVVLPSRSGVPYASDNPNNEPETRVLTPQTPTKPGKGEAVLIL